MKLINELHYCQGKCKCKPSEQTGRVEKPLLLSPDMTLTQSRKVL